ncbi:DUF2946 domain-containing protein [Vibrio palustris]|uniref:DUF2946 domain-containing protein n=1 Tax=Vibrio palustris TaxID=1918946 RepID=A0A1R4B2N7_9VIBR|nr:DUF2946 domain-containing protein [Vibrio palustris]SJL83175.1 hypothetical protein VPAL9027_01124 [Vibrio palustris]
MVYSRFFSGIGLFTLSQQRFRQPKFLHIVSQLALFAILLLYIAPVISMSIVMTRHQPLMDMSSTMTSSKTVTMAAMSPSSMSHHGGWCQYCDLLATLHGSTSLALIMPPVAGQLILTPIEGGQLSPIDNRTSHNLPRAPPVIRSLPFV